MAGCVARNGIWEPQLRLARSIDNPIQRAEAVATATEAAASIGDLATVKSGLRDLTDDPRHDEVAERCAIQLGNGAHWFAAIEVARLIKDDTRRKAALIKVGG